MNEPNVEKLEKRLDRLERENRRLKRLVALILILGSLVILFSSGPASSAEKTVVPTFKNVDEAIGWVKAKGNCEKIGKEQQGSLCEIRFDLPAEKTAETKGETVWQRWAWMRSYDLESMRHFSVHIVRSKNVLLSANDPKTTVRSVRVSNYWFDKTGKVFEASVDSDIENFKGEKILRQGIPIPLDSIHKHGDGGYDSILFRTHLGIGWNYSR